MARLLTLLLFVAGAVRVWFDWQETIAIAATFRFANIGTVWSAAHSGSFEMVQAITDKYISEGAMSFAMLTPLAPLLFGLAAIFWLFRRKKR